MRLTLYLLKNDQKLKLDLKYILSLTLRRANSDFSFAARLNSVVQTGVKSAG
jgi:hypothetical protein